MRPFHLIIAISLFAFVTLNAGEYQIVYQRQIEGAENCVNIDPILGSSRELIGFIFSFGYNDKVKCMYLDSGQPVLIEIDRRASRTVNYFSDGNDTLYVYILDGRGPASLARYTLLPDLTATDSFTIDLGFPLPLYGYYQAFFNNLDFSAVQTPSTPVIRVSTYRHMHNEFGYCDFYDEELSTTVVFSSDLEQEYKREPVTFLERGEVGGTSAIVSFTNRYWEDAHKEYYPDWWECVVVERRWSCFDLRADDDSSLSQDCQDDLLYRSLFVDNFVPDQPNDEIIVQHENRSNGLLFWWGREYSTVCYSLSGDSLVTLWSQSTGDLVLQHSFRPGNVIVGTGGRYYHDFANDSLAVFLDHTTGMPVDTISLGRNLRIVKFFETGDDVPVLNLAGRVHDTIFVYQFRTPTDVEEPGDNSDLPRTFTLHQNYPNPFNSSTLISFDSHSRQQVKLVVYNLLGEEVVTLVDKTLPAGEYSFKWDGVNFRGNRVASGNYLARLSAGGQSQSVKMSLVK